MICQRHADQLSLRLRQITQTSGFDNSWYHAQPHPIIISYFAITKFNNCFIIQSPSLFSHFISLSDTSEKWSATFNLRSWIQWLLSVSRILFVAKHFYLDGTPHEQTIIFWAVICKSHLINHVFNTCICYWSSMIIPFTVVLIQIIHKSAFEPWSGPSSQSLSRFLQHEATSSVSTPSFMWC